MAFKLPDLNYSYDALEPYIDSKTMEIHYGKHHAGYTSNLNNAIQGTEMENYSINQILENLDMSNSALRNNSGGFFNHCLFWEIIGPNCGGTPSGDLLNSITDNFESFENFKNLFSKAAATRFGSGWAWLCVLENGKLEICSTANQDVPIMPGIGCGGSPILGIDVWEHAYYLNYQNRRPDYINAFFNIINWEKVNEKYLAVS
ncbi:MAG: superoxide dismutase [Flavobacteriaceae bacterium]|nr:superoxide dismutase [Flavobacteriaceae bacterium]|tara:strand:- start:404 stop:1012 length:609 start_codon:yes stop_codon:yes gene_type:complete